jgi:hypothetical protein
MLNRLNAPLWPDGKLNLTTPLSLLLTAASVITGIIIYLAGYTYEGATLVYMLGSVMFAWPYYAARYTNYMTFLVLTSFVPMSIWLQNKGVETGAWYYRDHGEYLAWITKGGEGWWQSTRHVWLGNNMPAMEYVFYPLFCLFQVVLYALYSHLLPDCWFEQVHPALKAVFPVIFTLLFGILISLHFFYAKPDQTDYVYWLTLVGYVITGATYCLSPNYRHYTQAPAFWIWVIGMGILFMPLWEIYHCCINRDWVYDPQHTFPFLYSFRGAGFPVSQPFGYITTATTFKALMMLLMLNFGHLLVKNPTLVPFSRKAAGHHQP